MTSPLRLIATVLLALACVAPVVLLRTPAAAPLLGVSGARMTVDGSPRFLVFLSYFDGVRRTRAGGADGDLRYLRDHVDGIRVLPNWWASTCPLRSGEDTLIDVDGAIREPVWRDLERLLGAAASAGLIVDLSFTRETVTDNETPPRTLSHVDYERALRTVVGESRYLKGRFPNVLIDVQNEWTRFASPAQVEHLLQAVHDADATRVLAASVSGDTYVPAGRQISPMVAAYHDPRGSDWFTPTAVARVVRGVQALVSQPVYLQEPMPASTVCDGQIVDRNMAHFTEALIAAKRSNAAAWTFHTRTAFDLSTQSLMEKLTLPQNAAERQAIEKLRN